MSVGNTEKGYLINISDKCTCCKAINSPQVKSPIIKNDGSICSSTKGNKNRE